MKKPFILLCLLTLFCCSSDDNNDSSPEEQSGHTIKYVINGNGTMDYLHYFSSSTSTSVNLESSNDISLPFEMTIENYSGNKVGLRAIIDYTQSEITSFEIYMDGSLLQNDDEPDGTEINHWAYDIETTF